MRDFDWQQAATLQLLNRRGGELGKMPVLDGPFISAGSLADAVIAFTALSRRDRSFARLEIRFGFHLDGLEIAALENVRR